MEKNKVIIDADFFRHATDIEPNSNVLETMLNELNMSPVMHKYVASVELADNTCLEKLIEAGKIEIIGEADFINEDVLEEYTRYFRGAYRRINGLDLGDDVDILHYGYSFEARKESLGEIRSIYLALKMGFKIFMSDDNGSKLVVKYASNSKHPLDVWKLNQLLEECHKNGTVLSWRDIRNIVAKGINNEADREKIKNLYAVNNCEDKGMHV